MPVRGDQGWRLIFTGLPPLSREDRRGEGGDGQPSREVEQMLETGPSDEHKADHGPDDETDSLCGGEKPHGLGPPFERCDIGHVDVGCRAVAAQPEALHEPAKHQERDRTGQQVDHVRKPIEGCADQDQGATAPGVGQPAQERAKEHGGQGDGAAHQPGLGLASPQADDIYGQSGGQHLHAEGIDEIGQRREDEIRGQKTILRTSDSCCIPGTTP